MPKYPLLPINALEILEKEFKLFLASFEIDREEWQSLKLDDKPKADAILEAFSDWVWTNVLQKTEYLEKREEAILYFFKVGSKSIQLLSVQANETYSGEPLNTLSEEDLIFELEFKRLNVVYTSKNFEGDANYEVYKLLINGCIMGDSNALKNLALKLG